MKKLQSMPCFIPVLRRLGDSWEVPDDMMDVLENSRTTSVNELYNMKLTHFCDTAASTFETSKSLNFFKSISMPKIVGAIHHMCKLSTCSSNLETRP